MECPIPGLWPGVVGLKSLTSRPGVVGGEGRDGSPVAPLTTALGGDMLVSIAAFEIEMLPWTTFSLLALLCFMRLCLTSLDFRYRPSMDSNV
ncbi:DNA-directed RNA polymerase II subunit RPB1 protein [Trifolium repens]|nr:DNA-directed RNA polymerase II subunit RPB1 protein [Trifolium repens]